MLTVLRVEKLRIDGIPTLSFEVAAGECLVIEGPSGAGKTRILRALADLDAPASHTSGGHVMLDGVSRNEVAAPVWRQRVRYCPAEPAWWATTARAHASAMPAVAARFDRHAAALGLPPALLRRPIMSLSTGERLRLGLALGLADEPRVILLDEPTAALDVQATALVEELIKFQLLSGRIVILVSHDAGQVARLSSSSLLLGAPLPSPLTPGNHV
jgi:ABC-type multidrug transport system ATPase subunit